MQWQEIDKHWQQFERMVKYRWQELTTIDLKQINGDKSILNLKLQGRYKQNKEEANRSIEDFLDTFQGILQGCKTMPLIKIAGQICVKPKIKPAPVPVKVTPCQTTTAPAYVTAGSAGEHAD